MSRSTVVQLWSVLSPITFITLALAAAPAHAEASLDCKNAETQGAMNMCARIAYEKADAAMNDTYRRLMAKLGESDKALLREAERAWIGYRDKACAFESSGTEGGSIPPMIVSQCLTAKTEAHTQDLKAQLDCAEGDLACSH